MNSTPSRFSLARYLESAAERSPQALALMTSGQSWSFADLLQRSREQAASPRLALSGTSLELALAAYAASCAEQSFWPRDPQVPQALLAPSVIVTPEIELVIETSGSEGMPKRVGLTPQNLSSATEAAVRCLDLRAGDCWLDCLPLFHIGGMAILWRCAQAGATVLLQEGFRVDAVRSAFAAQRVTHLSLVPAMLSQLLDADCPPPPGLRCALIGGAALSPDLFQRATAAGWPLFPSYGMTETAALMACYTGPAAAWTEGCVGKPLPGVQVSLSAEGRIQITGPACAAGYLGQAPCEGPLLTGDLGEWLPDGQLRIIGRADDMLISGGKKIHPLTVENCLSQCPNAPELAVTGLADPVWGEQIVAVVVGQVNEVDLLAWGAAHLPTAARPRRVIPIDALPRTAAGKLNRAALRVWVRTWGRAWIDNQVAGKNA